MFKIPNYKKKPMNRKKAHKDYKAIKRHESRSKRSKSIDESKTAKIVHKGFNKKWNKNPSKSDVRNVDTKKRKAKSVNEVLRFIKGVYPEANKVSKTKSIINFNKPIKDKRNKLERVANTRFANVRIKKRKLKNSKNQYRILLKK